LSYTMVCIYKYMGNVLNVTEFFLAVALSVAAAVLRNLNSQHSDFLWEKAANTPCRNAKMPCASCKKHRIAV
jgi:hypothetical protein